MRSLGGGRYGLRSEIGNSGLIAANFGGTLIGSVVFYAAAAAVGN